MACKCEGCQKTLDTITDDELLEELERRKAKRRYAKLDILKIFTDSELRDELSNRVAERYKIEQDTIKEIREEIFNKGRKNG